MVVARIRSVVYWTFVVISSFALFPIALSIWTATVLFDERLVLLHRFTCYWAGLYTWLSPAWRVSVVGREKIEPDTTYVMVANHQSLIDIFVLYRLFTHFKWVSKTENFRLPAVGWNMRLNRYIELRRGDKESTDEMMEACRATLASGSSVMMFPEGTRSRDGQIRPFKHGAFTLAKQARVPILPIVVEGTFDALPNKGLLLHGRQDIVVRVLDPIPYERFADTPVETLVSSVRTVIDARFSPSHYASSTAARPVDGTRSGPPPG